MVKKPKGLNKRIQEIKYGTLYMAERLGTERILRQVFDKFEKSIPKAATLTEPEIRTLLFKIAVSEKAHVHLQNALHYFDQLPKQRASEKETREGITRYALALGVPQQDIDAIFNKYDKMLESASSEDERQQIAYMGGVEVHKLLHNRKALVMDGKMIIPAEEGLEEEGCISKFRKVD